MAPDPPDAANLNARPTVPSRSVLIAAILGSAVVFLDGTVVNVALPAIRAGLHGDLSDQQWVVEAYLLTLASLLLVGGSLGDLRGRRRVMADGLIGFGICSLVCAVAPSATVLIVARAAQGLFGALLVPSSLALIVDNYPDAEAQGAAIGTWTAYAGISSVIGPLAGGWLVEAASWRWIFAINAIPVVVTLWTLRRVPESPRVGREIDVLGGVLAVFGLAGPVFALIEQPSHGWGDPRVLAPLLTGIALLALLIAHERTASEPMLPLHLFAARNFSVGNLTTFAVYAGLSVATFFIVVYIQQVGGYTPLEAGLALLPVTVIMFALSRRWGALAAKFGPRLFMGIGPIIAGVGLLLERRVGASPAYVTTVLPGLVVFALGLSMTVAPLTATVLGAAAPGHSGVASGVNNAISRVAGLIAIAAIGAVVAASFARRLATELPADTLTPAARIAVERARGHPLVTSAAGAPRADRAEIHLALLHASVGAFGVGMEIAAVLAMLGGLISLFGLQRVRTASETGGPETGHRSA